VILVLGGVLRCRWGPGKRFLFIYLFIFQFCSLLLVSSFRKVGELFSNKKMAFPILFEWVGELRVF
jgi:hypothetical protein